MQYKKHPTALTGDRNRGETENITKAIKKGYLLLRNTNRRDTDVEITGMYLQQLLNVEQCLILEKSVESRKSTQALDLSGYMKKALITNKVTTHFFITPSKSIAYTSFSHPTDFSRLMTGVLGSTLLVGPQVFMPGPGKLPYGLPREYTFVIAA